MADLSAVWRFALVASKMGPQPKSLPITAPSKGPIFATPDTFVDRIYRRNLATLKFLAERTGAYTFFVPQVLNDAWYAEHSGGDWWTPHIDNRAMPGLIRRFGTMIDETCGPHELRCGVIGEVRAWQWKPSDFIDEGHFSGKG